VGQWLADRRDAALSAVVAYLAVKVLVLLPLWEGAVISALVLVATAAYHQKKTPNLGS